MVCNKLEGNFRASHCITKVQATSVPKCIYIFVAQAACCLTTGWMTGVRSPTGAEDFSSSLCVQTGSGAHPASCSMGTGGPFPGGKAQPGHDADHSPLSSAEFKNEQELYLLSPHAPPWRVAGSLYLLPLFKNK
jgi:hypothetical protein